MTLVDGWNNYEMVKILSLWYFRTVFRFFKDNEDTFYRNLMSNSLNLKKNKSNLILNNKSSNTAGNNDFVDHMINLTATPSLMRRQWVEQQTNNCKGRKHRSEI